MQTCLDLNKHSSLTSDDNNEKTLTFLVYFYLKVDLKFINASQSIFRLKKLSYSKFILEINDRVLPK